MDILRHTVLVWWLVAGGAAIPGCKEDQPDCKTMTLSGTVEKLDLANSRVEISYYSKKHDKTVTTKAIVTPETEIFINGIAARLEDVRVGERAEGEVIVTRENHESVITVTRVRIERAAPIVPGRPAEPESDEDAPSPDGSDGK